MQLAVLKNYKTIGKLHGDGDAFASGAVKHYNMNSVETMYKLLKSVATGKSLCVSIGTYPKDGNVLTRDKAKIGDMTRTEDGTSTGHILVLDNDFNKDYDRDIFKKHWRAFDGVGSVITKSGSTLLGKKKHGSHTYYLIDKGVQNLKTVMAYMEAVCIIEGYCATEIQKTGRAVVKTPIDMALSQKSRIVYEDDVAPTYIEGEKLDISSLPNNYNKVLNKALKIKNKMLGKVEKQSLKTHKTYVKELTGVKLKKKKDIKDSLKSYGKYEIDENFKLYSDNKMVGTVADLILGKIDTIGFADLYEPDYAGGSQKAIYYPESKTFFSQAHGGIKYEVVLTKKFNETSIKEFLKEVPYLKDIVEMSNELKEIINVRDIIQRKSLIRDYAKILGVTAVDIEKELSRLAILQKQYDMFYNLWLKGEYFNAINANTRLAHFIEYQKNAHFINMNGKNIILNKYIDDKGNKVTRMNPITTELEFESDKKSTLMCVDETTQETTFKEVDTPTLFIEGTQGIKGDFTDDIIPCKRYIGLEFAPKKELDVAYNLFDGFKVEPKKGSIKIWKKHMIKIYGKSHYNFMMDWFADMYQNPDRKVGFALVVKGKKGCVPCDTEFLTPNGWKRIDEYVEGDLVCEWSPDGSTSFKKPLGYTKVKAEGFTNVKSMTVDMTLSEGHRVPYITSKKHHGVKSFHEIRKMSNYTIPRKFNTPDNTQGIDMTDDEIRLLIAQTADGTLLKKQIRINIKKERKKLRIVEIFEKLNIEYNEVQSKDGFTRYTYYPLVSDKSLKILWAANEAQMIIIYNEMLKWDGSEHLRDGRIVKRFTGNKQDCDLFQYIASCVSGKYVTMIKDNREYKKCDIYNVNVSTRATNNVSKQDKISKVESIDGLQYCFTTKSSFWLMRQNGRIYPTGNTGKNTFEEVLGRSLLSYDNYFRTANQEQLFGKFNGVFASNLLIVGQEISWGGDHKYDSILKDMITENTRTIEIKGMDSFTLSNYSRLYLTSNSDWVVPATADERRFYVVETLSKVHSKQAWKDFYNEVRKPEMIQVLMYEMMNRDLSKFDNTFCPATEELSEQQHESLYGVDRFIAESLENGFFGKGDSSEYLSKNYVEGSKVRVQDLYNIYMETQKYGRAKNSLAKFSRALTKLGYTKRYKISKKNCILLGSIKHDIEMFHKNTGATIIHIGH